MNIRIILLLGFLTFASCTPDSPDTPPPVSQASVADAADQRAVAVSLPGVDNLYRVGPDLYRSGQPDSKGFRALARQGVRSVLNLREYHKDDSKAKGSGLQLYRHSMAAGSITEADIEQCLLVLRHAPKPALVHCMHGSDRTGTIVAAYRIVEQGWDVERAIAELKDGGFGYHQFWYPGIPKLIRSIDWAAMRARLDSGR